MTETLLRGQRATLERFVLISLTSAITPVLLTAVACAQTPSSNFPTVIDAPPDSAPAIALDGTQLNLHSGQLGPFFSAGLSGASQDVEVNLYGGFSGDFFQANEGSRVNLRNAILGSFYQGFAGSTTTTYDGEVGPFFEAFGGSTLNLLGGSFFPGIQVQPDSTVNVFAQSASVGDFALLLPSGTTVEIEDRDIDFYGTLANGMPFSFDLNSQPTPQQNDYFSPEATLTLTIVGPGDFNLDGVADGADYDAWSQQYGAQPVPELVGPDGNFDNRVDAADYTLWRDALVTNGNSPAVIPEPSAGVILLIGWMSTRRGRG